MSIRKRTSCELRGASWRLLHPLMYFAALLLLSVPALLPMLTTDLTCGYDNTFHLWRAVQVARCLRQGYLYPRWAPDMAHGYGFPLFIFQSPLSAYVAALVNLAGLSWPMAINATFLLGMLLGGCCVFILARDLFGPAAGLVAAVAYLFAPFQAYDMFNRGSLSESFAWAFPPLVLWAVHRWSVGGRRGFLVLAAFSLAGLILTHNLFAFLFAPLLAGWVLLEGYLARNWRVIGRGALAGLLGLGLCTFFWLPGLAERGWVQTERLLGTWVFDYHNNFLDLRQLLAPPRVADPALINDWPPKALGLLPTLVALLPLARWRRLSRQTRWRVALLLVCAAGFAFLTLPASRPLWERLPLLPYIQFPWRFLGPAAFSVAMLAGTGVSARSQQSGTCNLQSAIIIPLLMLGNLGWFYPRYCPPPHDTSIGEMIAFERATDTLGTTAKGEQLPIWVHRMPEDQALDAAYAAGESIVRLRPESLPEGARVIRAEYGPVDATVELESPLPFTARYLAFYYPGWRVTVDGASVPVAPTDPDGLISFDVPAGRHTVYVRFAETPLRLTADILSLLSLAALIAILGIRPFGHALQDPQAAIRPSQPAIAHRSLLRPSLFVLLGLALLTAKAIILDRMDTPLRRTNLVDDHLRDVDVSTEVTFGDDFVLLGHDALPERVSSGERFEVKTYWRALRPGGPDYRVTVHVADTQGRHWHGPDIRTPRWHRTPPPVWEWSPDQYAIVALSVPLLPGTPPGRYTIEAVAFDRDTLVPLTAHDTGGYALGPALPLHQITVMPPHAPPDPDALGIRHRLDATLGPLTLLGADFDRDQAAPGDPVFLTTFWRADRRPTEDLTIHLALVAPDGSPAAEYDILPTVAWHPTSVWQPGDVWRGQHVLHLPAHLEDDDHTWHLTLLPTSSSAHLPTPLTITALDRTFSPPLVDVETDTALGDVITLLGATVQPQIRNVQPGTTLTTTLVWRADRQPPTSYHVFLHLVGPDGALLVQSDGIPADWTRPTTGWLPGEYVTDVRVLTIPPDAAAGEYILSAGLYVPGGERLSALDGADALTLTTIKLEPQP